MIVLAPTIKVFFYKQTMHFFFYSWWDILERALFSLIQQIPVSVELFLAYTELWKYHLQKNSYMILKIIM